MYLGIDLGTSEVKAVLVDDAQRCVARAGVKLQLSRPQRLWSEQAPEDWWQATCDVVKQLRASARQALSSVTAIGLSGQMHGAVLIDAADRVLRPAILWNDSRAFGECEELERAVPRSREITGNLAMCGFTAPKLLWLRRHEPECFARVAKVLLPKDYLGLRLTGDHVSEISDSSGTLWLDVGRRDWSDAMLAASGLDRSHMPRLVEGNMARGLLREELRRDWGIAGEVTVAAGAGDNPAAAVGVGVIEPGDALLSLGTSGVMFAASDRFLPDPDAAVHAFGHALPQRWCHMAVTLSATSCLSWAARITGSASEVALAEAAESAVIEDAPLFLPYLSGERTPHNDPRAQGVFFGLGSGTDRAAVAYSVLEGVAFALSDGYAALCAAGDTVSQAAFVGGGSRSRFWGRLISAASGVALVRPAGGDLGGAFGAARLARMALTGAAPAEVCTKPRVHDVIEPEPLLAERLATRHARHRRLYVLLREEFQHCAPGGRA